MEVKGTALLSAVVFVEETFGESGKQAVLQEFDESTRVLYQRILPNSWYDLDLLMNWMKTAHRLLAPYDSRFYRKMGRFSADYTLNRFYRFLLALASTERVVRRATAIWHNYYRPGDMEIVELEPKRTHLRLVGFQHNSAEFCERVMGWMSRVVELTGGKNPILEHPVCIAKGNESCEYIGSWT